MNEYNKFHKKLDDREAEILSAIINEYISSGKAVGSRSFVMKHSMSLSPATLRNIMFDLDTSGYLMQPHTSAGRIPTDFGYRFYVDSLLESYEQLNKIPVNIKEESIKKEVQLDKMFLAIAKSLANNSKYAGIVLTPKPDFAIVKQIELLSLDNNEVLVILITRTGMVLNKKVLMSDYVSQDDLSKFSRFLTSALCGYSLEEIKTTVCDTLRNDLSNSFNHDLAIDIAELSLKDEVESDLFVDGLENILHIHEMREPDQLMSFLHLIEEESLLKNIVISMLEKNGIVTLIGDEIPDKAVMGCSMVMSSYKISNKNVGVVGIIGPTRMDYEKVVPLVDYMSRMVTEYLTTMSK